MGRLGRTTEITLYLRGGHEMHIATSGPDDENIPRMREELKLRFGSAEDAFGSLELIDGTLVRADDIVAMSVDDVVYLDDPGRGLVRVTSWDEE